MSNISSVTQRSDIDAVLAEMRQFKSNIQSPTGETNIPSATRIQPSDGVNATESFNALFSKAIDQVNAHQMQSSALAKAYEQGDPNVSISEVMIQSQKSSVAFQALTQVRNKVVQAYEDVMKMPI